MCGIAGISYRDGTATSAATDPHAARMRHRGRTRPCRVSTVLPRT